MATAPKPWKAEYAKSSRASCRACSSPISKDTFRLARMRPATQFDGFMALWHHASCIFKKKRQIQTLADVEGADTLRWEDQQKLSAYIEDGGDGEFAIENAKSSRSACKSCGEKITKGEVRISTMVASDNARFRGKVPAWRHAKCFLTMGVWTSTLATMPGWDSLSAEDQTTVKALLKPSSKNSIPDGEAKVNSAAIDKKPIDKKQAKGKEVVPASREAIELDKKLEKQSKDMWELKDNLHQHVSTAELREMLIANNQDASGSEYDLRDRCVDGMMFGALDMCPLCKSPMEYQGGSYRCRGFLSAWSKCSFSTKTPQRAASKWQIPKNSDNEYLLQWVKRQSNKKGERLLAPTSTAAPEKSDQDRNSGFFSGCEFITYGRLSLSQVSPIFHVCVAAATCVVTTASSLENEKVRQDIQFAKSLPIVREQYLHDCLEQGKKLPTKGYELELGFKQEVVKVKVKGRGAVHEDSGLQETGHVLEDGKTIYTVTLNRSELSTGINSFYVLQIIEEDKTKSVHYVYRKWGRVGTSRIGGDKLEKLEKAAAIKEFKRLFREKTGNDWESWEKQENFEKQPGKFYPVEIDYGVKENPTKDLVLTGSKSKLHPRVINLMRMLFDIETYKAAMMEFEINMSEMPLGKLSKRHIEKGYQVLTEIQNIMAKDELSAVKDGLLVDASNRFFTLIPTVHPSVISDHTILKSKIGMLEALQDIEIASKFLGGSKGEEEDDEDPLDTQYKKLQCHISPLPHDSADFELVEKYLKRTHAPTHTEWALELEDVYAVEREGEYGAYVPFKETLENRTLLWHGSRTTNYVGILSQGLRIAPPEAPVTGYMFGKGLYFADLVSKSAQYCYTTKTSPTGLLLLSEVALGDIHELKSAKYMEKPARGSHSTKGLGKMKPRESEYEKWDDNVTVPCGSPVPSNVRSDLMYNEYIVYNTAQVRLRFLLKVSFKHKR
ncbi:unnamed protein product [Sphagnum troendelagicum]|uniref:Poly [ADP-ribose] polymerase n=1 Tax=Sphagnum troendelagicum TaxID=128251 RepID=A0ABP0UAL5_9BRYO